MIVFRDACRMEPEKFKNVTNGMDHRRWLSQINPASGRVDPGAHRRTAICTHRGPSAGSWTPYAEDAAVLDRLEEIKQLQQGDLCPAGAQRQQGRRS